MKTAAELGLPVQVEKRPGVSVGKMLSDMRVWLDHQGINPIGFKTITLAAGNVVFEVYFRNPQQAALFRAAFAPREARIEALAALA